MRGAEQDEQHGAEQHAAIELVDLPLDLLLPQRQRHGDDRARASPSRTGAAASRYCRVAEPARRRRSVGSRSSSDRAVDLARRARRQQAATRTGRARSSPAGPCSIEQVDVLVDDAAHRAPSRRRSARSRSLRSRRCWLTTVLDEALRGGRRAQRALFEAFAQLRRRSRRASRTRARAPARPRRDEREEQLAVEARADLAQQRAAGHGVAARRPGPAGRGR